MENIRREDWESLKPTVYGWGINDVQRATQIIEYFKDDTGKLRRKVQWVCPYYQDWIRMLQRCLKSDSSDISPTYIGCTIYIEWKYLSNFIKWVDSQPNKDWQNCALDKDLLVVGNKQYGPDTSVYLSKKLNNFLLSSGKTRGISMLGVCRVKNRESVYSSQCNNPFTKKRGHLGYFTDEFEAHKAWQAKKHEHALRLAEEQDDPRVAKALRERFAPDKDWSKS